MILSAMRHVTDARGVQKLYSTAVETPSGRSQPRCRRAITLHSIKRLHVTWPVCSSLHPSALHKLADSRAFFPFRTFPFRLSFARPRGGVDVPGALEVDVFLHSDEVGRKLPHVLAVVYDADHRVAAGEKVPAGWRGGGCGGHKTRAELLSCCGGREFPAVTITSVRFFICNLAPGDCESACFPIIFISECK